MPDWENRTNIPWLRSLKKKHAVDRLPGRLCGGHGNAVIINSRKK
jgi:hypothetical protein